jgi:hypothetical protein
LCGADNLICPTLSVPDIKSALKVAGGDLKGLVKRRGTLSLEYFNTYIVSATRSFQTLLVSHICLSKNKFMNADIKFVKKENQYVILEGDFGYTMPIVLKFVFDRYLLQRANKKSDNPVEQWYQSLDPARKVLIQKKPRTTVEEK